MSNPTSLESNNGISVVKGDLTFETVPQIIDSDIMTGDRVVIDLSGVTRSDSSGLALLVHWFRLGKSQSISVEFHNIPQNMMALAMVSNLDDVLPFVSH